MRCAAVEQNHHRIDGIRDGDGSATTLWNKWMKERGPLPSPKHVTLNTLLAYKRTSDSSP
jgi:hypothetical protein